MKLLLPLVFAVALAASAQERTPEQLPDAQPPQGFVPLEKFDPARDAAKDILDALDEARRSGRRVLLDVGGEWCVWCHRLDQFFKENKEVGDALHTGFVVVKVNYSKENKNEEVLSRYPKIKGYPHLFVLSETGELLHSQDTADLESGKGYDLTKVLTFLKKWRRPAAE